MICVALDHRSVLSLVEELGQMAAVREVRFRDDTGRWNTDPGYPDGLYLGIECTSSGDHRWNLDLWFVDEPERQPDLRHLHDLLPRLTEETRRAILEIKTGWCHHPEYGSSVTSVGIYQAVLDNGVLSLEEFNRRQSRSTSGHSK